MTNGPFRGGRRTRPLTWLLLSGLLIIACGPCLYFPGHNTLGDGSEDWDWADEDNDYPDDDSALGQIIAQPTQVEPELCKGSDDAYLSLLRSQPAEQMINAMNMVIYTTPIKRLEQEGLSSEQMVSEIRRQWSAVNDLSETEYRALRCFWLAMFAVKYEMPEASEMINQSIIKINQATTLEYAQPSQESSEGWYMAWLRYHQSNLVSQAVE
ncbi:MAG: hypothetical protein ABIH67_01705 [Candidatus Uhrbacteria bacterium]